METIILGDALEQLRNLPDESIHTCVTSPPYYGLRNYETEGQIGLEPTPQEYIERLTAVFHEVKRVLRSDSTLWIVIGDSYNGYKASAKRRNFDSPYAGFRNHPARPGGYGLEDKTLKPKDMIGIPWMLAFALRDDGYYLRQDIIWHKTNCMPESVVDRCTRSHEYIFLLTKAQRYYFDADAIREPLATAERKGERRSYRAGMASSYDLDGGHMAQRGNFAGLPLNPKGKNKRDVWTVSTGGFKGAHFAVFPEKLIEPCVLAGCPPGGTVLDPFTGSGTTGVVAKKLRRNFIGIELNPEYRHMAEDRIAAVPDQISLFEQEDL